MAIFSAQGQVRHRPFQAYIEMVEPAYLEIPGCLDRMAKECKSVENEIGVDLLESLGQCFGLEKGICPYISPEKTGDASIAGFVIEALVHSKLEHVKAVPAILNIEDIMFVR